MKIKHILIGITLLLLLSACGAKKETLTVLAGSELKDLQPMLMDINKCANTELQFEFTGTLNGAEKLAQGAQYDLAWFSHGKYISLLKQSGNRIVAQDKIMLSPVVMGVKKNKAQQFGWNINESISWRDIAEKASTGELRYAMTNPASSNSGFTTLVGVASALSADQRTFDLADIDNEAMKDFFKGQVVTAGSSGWLAETYVKQQDKLDAIINYESVLMQLNNSGQLKDQLELIYPDEGIITADYPIMLLNAEKKAAYTELVDCLRSVDTQEKLMTLTQRRPAIPQVKVSSEFSKKLLVELPFPGTLDQIDKLLFSYLDEHRKPSHTFFVLDVSASMNRDERIDRLKTSLSDLTGLDNSITGQFARFRSRETVTMIPFNDRVKNSVSFQINNGSKDDKSMRDLRLYINNLNADGGTAIYSALNQAYEELDKAYQLDRNKFYSIVLLTDGANRNGIDINAFVNNYRGSDTAAAKTFPILFGNSDDEKMNYLSEVTGGRTFDAKKSSLNDIFKTIRGYQ